MTIEIELSADDQLRDSQALELSGLLYSIYQSAITPQHTERLKILLGEKFRSEALSRQPQLIDKIIQHMQRAIRIGNRFARLKEERDQLLEYLDEFIPPVFVVDNNGALVGSNSRANSMLQNTTLFSSQFSNMCEYKIGWLELLLERCKRKNYAHTVVLDSNNHQWRIYCYRLDSQRRFALLCLDATKAIEETLSSFIEKCHLTQKEIEVIRLLLHETPPISVAKQLAISPATVRQHIKNILSKTQTRSQHELLTTILEQQIIKESTPNHHEHLTTQLVCADRTRILHLANGRQLSYAEFGALNGEPILYFHSLISSRYELAMYHEWLSTQRIRLICIDRPGYGHSSFWDIKNLSEYAEVINYLLDHMGFDKISILACSAGCAHAMRFANDYPTQVKQLHLAGIVPEQRFINSGSIEGSTARQAFAQAKRVAPKLFRPALDLFFHGQTVESMLDNLDVNNHLLRHSQLDIDYIKDVKNLPFFKAAMIESLRQGSRAWAMESSLILGSWGIDYEKFSTPTTLWHGDEDVLTSLGSVEALANSLGKATLQVIRGESHFLIYRQLTNILTNSHPLAQTSRC